jgi:hypothetical protein
VFKNGHKEGSSKAQKGSSQAQEEVKEVILSLHNRPLALAGDSPLFLFLYL